MTAVHQPQPGDRYAAPWGEYCVVRVEPDRVALRDLARPTACVVPTPAKLLAEYSLVRAATPAAEHRDVKPANVPPPAAEQLRRCSDCKRPSRVLWATDRAGVLRRLPRHRPAAAGAEPGHVAPGARRGGPQRRQGRAGIVRAPGRAGGAAAAAQA